MVSFATVAIAAAATIRACAGLRDETERSEKEAKK